MDQANSLEAFIEKLHEEGVEAGLQEAEQLRAAAKAESTTLVEEAQETARRIVADAEARATAKLAEAKAELALVVRDVQLELRERLEATLTSLLEEGLERPLEDPEILAQLLVEVVRAHLRAENVDSETQTFEATVRPELLQELTAAAPARLGRALGDRARLDLKGELGSAGFEVRVRDGIVQVTPQSVAEKLGELMSPQLRGLLRAAANRPKPATR